MKGQEALCLFSSNYPHTCRPFPFSHFLSVFLVDRCSVAVFPFVFSHNSHFSMFLPESAIMQSVLLCEDASLDASRPLASTTITSFSRAFYLGFLNPDHSINSFCSRARTQRSWHVPGGGKMNSTRMEMSTRRRCCHRKILLLWKWHPLKPCVSLEPFCEVTCACGYERGHCAFIFLFLQRMRTVSCPFPKWRLVIATSTFCV